MTQLYLVKPDNIPVDKKQARREKKLYQLVIQALTQMKQKDVGRADAARYGFAWGIKAKERVDEIEDAIRYFENLIDGLF